MVVITLNKIVLYNFNIRGLNWFNGTLQPIRLKAGDILTFKGNSEIIFMV